MTPVKLFLKRMEGGGVGKKDESLHI